MEGLNELLATPLSSTIGWTLLHSLWQGLLLTLAVVILLRFIPSRYSNARYLTALGGLAMIVLSGIVTFVMLLPKKPAMDLYHNLPLANALIMHKAGEASPSFIGQVVGVIQANMNWVMIGWVAGMFFFSLRLISGWWQIIRLKQTAITLNNDWSNKLLELAYNLGIKCEVILAESSRISVPMVIGYVKPMVLVPLGMLSGLTSDQVETILIHELTHIKRYDYIINVFQSITETTLFFNPFVWFISSLIRKEREYCCDDEVLHYGNPLVYAHALTRLEEERLHKPGLAMSATDNKFHLLNRIKRIIEKPVNSHSLRERLIPVALLIILVACASWLSAQSPAGQYSQRQLAVGQKKAPADTTKNKKEKQGIYVRKSITTIDENGNPRTEVTENFEGDEQLRPVLAMPHFHFDVSSADQNFDMLDSTFIPFNNFDSFGTLMQFHFPSDTFPESGDWENYAREFEKMFHERFGDFYDAHEEDMKKMLEDLDIKFKSMDFDMRDVHPEINEELQQQMVEAKKRLGHLHHLQEFNQEAVNRQIDMQMKASADQIRQLQLAQELQLKALAMDEERINAFTHGFEREFEQQLRKDGYLGKNEKIETLRWDEDKDHLAITVNGKEIKEKDKKKYKALHDDFLRKMHDPRPVVE